MAGASVDGLGVLHSSHPGFRGDWRRKTVAAALSCHSADPCSRQPSRGLGSAGNPAHVSRGNPWEETGEEEGEPWKQPDFFPSGSALLGALSSKTRPIGEFVCL